MARVREDTRVNPPAGSHRTTSSSRLESAGFTSLLAYDFPPSSFSVYISVSVFTPFELLGLTLKGKHDANLHTC